MEDGPDLEKVEVEELDEIKELDGEMAEPEESADQDEPDPVEEEPEELEVIPIPVSREHYANSLKRSRRRRRIWRFVKFSFFLLSVLLIIGIVGGVGAYFYCMPRYELAQTFDMDKIDDLEVASKIYDRNGVELGRIHVQNRQPIPISEVSKTFTQALLAAEDSRFYTHDGVDYRGVLRAVVENFKAGEMNQGASTITQQLARNAFDLREKSISRKVTEAFLARRIEEEIGEKDKILELYMNRIYFGDGYYGIAAAAEGFFGKKATELNYAESATLAGVIRNPYYRGPRKFPDASIKTRNQVLARMHKLGYITEEQKDSGQNAELKPVPKKTQSGRSKYVYESVRQQVIELIGGYDTVSKGGYTIFTTIDTGLQQIAEEKLRERLSLMETHPDYQHQTLSVYKAMKEQFANGSEPPTPEYLQGSLLMIENKTGAILAQVGGRDFSDSMFDRTRLGKRPSGTAFLPFVYAAAFESGRFPGSIVDDAPMDNRYLQIASLEGIVGEWGTENFENVYENSITYRRALSKSAIAASVRVGMEAQRENVLGLAKAAGLTFEGDLQNFNATFVGRNYHSMSDLCRAYTIFPNDGVYPEEIHLISSIKDADGNEIYQPRPRMSNRMAIDKYTAYQVTNCLQDSLKNGAAKKAISEYGLGDFSVAGKP
ncbi:MAG: hypothetical protein HKN23_04470, partial [Verrucomicrobiales bacterium]|nr:hypothetical protein [Verrucomicrobiales bacterium]